jgi:hypothetical protein
MMSRVDPIPALAALNLRDKPASREVYDIIDLRYRIFSLLPKKTLAVLLRLEKAVTGSVVDLLYRQIDKYEVIRAMDRSTVSASR